MPVNGSKRRDDVLNLNLTRESAVTANLGGGYDVVSIAANAAVAQVRLTFTSAEVGNGSSNDTNTGLNQDGGLAVHVQREDRSGALTDNESRFDDEGISFVSDGTFTFDIRDLVSGTARGDQFVTARLGTSGDDLYLEGRSAGATYINAGAGNDTARGGNANDFLVGGAGNDVLYGLGGNDSFIGGSGDDMIFGGAGRDTAIFNIATDGADAVTLGAGLDTVSLSAAAETSQVRLTFTSAEVGNGTDSDSGSLANQDGGLAVRMQAEDDSGGLTGVIGRFDDEGVRFVAATGFTFDVRDLVSGTARGDAFGIVELGTAGRDRIDGSADTVAQYINGGAGNDRIIGGASADFLVGGAGDDRLDGGDARDTLLGGSGADTFVFRDFGGDETIADFVSGEDTIDLRALNVRFADVSVSTFLGDTYVGVDMDGNGSADLTIELTGVTTAPDRGDFVF